jgi:hypothetical protein
MRKGLLLLLIAVVMTGQAKAEDPKCTADDTVEGCFTRLGKDWALLRTQRSTAAVNTGVTGLLTPSQSATKDFLSKLTAAFAVPMTGDGSRPVSLAWNIPIPRLGGGEDGGRGNEHLNLQTVFAKPPMSGELKERIGSNDAAVAEINDSLSEFDDLTIRASFGPSMHGLGRSIAPHKIAYDAMLGHALDGMVRANGGVDRSTKLSAMTASPSAIQTAIETEASQFAEGFSILLNNQPQLYGEVKYRALKNVAGPDEHSMRLTYEKGFHNLKAFYKAHPKCDNDEPAGDCASLLMDAANEAEKAPEDRLAVSIEYRRWSALSVVIPDLVNFSAPRARSLVYSVTYGRNHMLMKEGRLDVEVNYEDTSARTVTDVVPPALFLTGNESEAVRDRFVASATYTYQINGQMAMPLTLTYANHGSFLGNVDRKLNAHFGLSFKMPSR